MKDPVEKRRNARYNCQVPIECKKGTVFEDSQTVDISQGGVGFIANKAIPLDTKMAIEIDLTPESEPLLVLGQVKWIRQLAPSNSYRVGMTFANIAAEFQSHLKRCLNK